MVCGKWLTIVFGVPTKLKNKSSSGFVSHQSRPILVKGPTFKTFFPSGVFTNGFTTMGLQVTKTNIGER